MNEDAVICPVCERLVDRDDDKRMESHATGAALRDICPGTFKTTAEARTYRTTTGWRRLT